MGPETKRRVPWKESRRRRWKERDAEAFSPPKRDADQGERKNGEIGEGESKETKKSNKNNNNEEEEIEPGDYENQPRMIKLQMDKW